MKHAERKQPASKGHTVSDSIHMKCPEKADPQRQKLGAWVSGAGEREEWGVTTKGCGISFEGDEENVLKLIMLSYETL